MTTVAYALGRPRPAASRGGDCRAHDLDQERDVHGPHRFAATTHAQISNGMLRLTVGASGAAPSLTVEAWRGRVTVEDYLPDILPDILPGHLSTPEWLDIFTLTIDSPSVSALLTAVQIARINPEAITIRLVAPLMADAFVTLRRGMPAVHIQHGSTRSPTISTTRRVRITASPSPTGTAYAGRVEEMLPTIEGFPRFVSAHGAVTANAGAFSLTSVSTASAQFGAGVGTLRERDYPADLHGQLADASRPRLVVA